MARATTEAVTKPSQNPAGSGTKFGLVIGADVAKVKLSRPKPLPMALSPRRVMLVIRVPSGLMKP